MKRLAARLAAAAPHAALATPVLLALPPVRGALESSMTLHMLVQFPLLAAAGFVLAGRLPARRRACIDRWNACGIAGLLACALVLSVLMVPRLLDLAIEDVRIDLLKGLSLLACGAALRLSWRRAGRPLQGFFLGNVLPMTAVAGQLYQDSPVRLCNAYLLGDQVFLGQMLVLLALATALGWMVRVFGWPMRRKWRSFPCLPSEIQ